MAEDLGISTTAAALEISKVPVLRCCPWSLHCSAGNLTQKSFHEKSKAALSIFLVFGLSVGLCAPPVLCLVEKGERRMTRFLPRSDKQEP